MRNLLRAGALLLPLPALAAQTTITLGTAPPPPPGYTALPYANPNAPKRGSLTLAGQGDFDSLNPFILRGTTPDTILQIWQPLFKLSDTDSVTAYAELAQSVDINGRQITFHLNPAAKFSDNTPVTASDVVWTFDTLTTQGSPFYAAEYAQVGSAAAPDAKTVTFTLRPGAAPDTIFNLAGLYVLPAHFWAHRDFATPLRDPPIGSGPYRVTSVAWGNSITYTHIPNWWATNIPSDKGFYNFTTITELFFQNKAALTQAFRAGQIDANIETSPSLWAAARSGQIKRELVPETLPAGMSGLAINTRRPQFADPRVRQALTLAFDFEWTNRALYGGSMTRDTSYFSNSPMAAPDPPIHLPVTDGSGYNLPQLEQAMALLTAAGWHIQNFQLVNAANQPFTLEIALDDAQDERIAIPYAHNLGLLGITGTIRTLDPATYQRRLQNFDFDLTDASFPVSDDPGSEQSGYWSCAAAATPGSQNLTGACAPAIDAAIQAELAAPTPEAKRTAIHALDRALLSGWYVIPWFHPTTERLEYWPAHVTKPAAPLQVGHDFSLWWAP